MKKFEKYINDIKSQLICNLTNENKSEFISYNYSNEQIDSNLDYFKSCMKNGISGYKALLFFNDYLRGDYKV